MDGDDETKLMTHVEDDHEFDDEGTTALGEHIDEEVGVGGIVGQVEEQKNVAQNAVHSKDTRDDQRVLVAKPFQVRPAERLARQQARRVVEVLEGVHAGIEDRDEHLPVYFK